MGSTLSMYLDTYLLKPDEMPKAYEEPTFDPMFGFSDDRKPREMLMSEEDMMAAKIPRSKRDYCAHKYMDYLQCQRIHFPFMLKCAHERHEYNRCVVEDATLRLKEYERERRLLARKKRKELQAMAA